MTTKSEIRYVIIGTTDFAKKVFSYCREPNESLEKMDERLRVIMRKEYNPETPLNESIKVSSDLEKILEGLSDFYPIRLIVQEGSMESFNFMHGFDRDPMSSREPSATRVGKKDKFNNQGKPTAPPETNKLPPHMVQFRQCLKKCIQLLEDYYRKALMNSQDKMDSRAQKAKPGFVGEVMRGSVVFLSTVCDYVKGQTCKKQKVPGGCCMTCYDEGTKTINEIARGSDRYRGELLKTLRVSTDLDEASAKPYLNTKYSFWNLLSLMDDKDIPEGCHGVGSPLEMYNTVIKDWKAKNGTTPRTVSNKVVDWIIKHKSKLQEKQEKQMAQDTYKAVEGSVTVLKQVIESVYLENNGSIGGGVQINVSMKELYKLVAREAQTFLKNNAGKELKESERERRWLQREKEILEKEIASLNTLMQAHLRRELEIEEAKHKLALDKLRFNLHVKSWTVLRYNGLGFLKMLHYVLGRNGEFNGQAGECEDLKPEAKAWIIHVINKFSHSIITSMRLLRDSGVYSRQIDTNTPNLLQDVITKTPFFDNVWSKEETEAMMVKKIQDLNRECQSQSVSDSRVETTTLHTDPVELEPYSTFAEFKQNFLANGQAKKYFEAPNRQGPIRMTNTCEAEEEEYEEDEDIEDLATQFELKLPFGFMRPYEIEAIFPQLSSEEQRIYMRMKQEKDLSEEERAKYVDVVGLQKPYLVERKGKGKKKSHKKVVKDSVKRKRGASTKGKGGKKSKVGGGKIDSEKPTYSSKDSKDMMSFMDNLEEATKSSDEDMEITVPADKDHIDDEEEYISEDDQ